MVWCQQNATQLENKRLGSEDELPNTGWMSYACRKENNALPISIYDTTGLLDRDRK